MFSASQTRMAESSLSPSQSAPAVAPNVSESVTLLSIPPEVRLVIYSRLLKGAKFHIQSVVNESTQTRDALYHRLCISNNLNPNFLTWDRCKSAAEFWGISPRYCFPDDLFKSGEHGVEDPYLPHYGCDLKNNKTNIDLAWLRTCKKIYGEASLILYKQHEFMFDCPQTLATFFGVPHSPDEALLASNQRPSMKFEMQNLQIHAIIRDSNHIDDWVRVCSSVCARMTDLRNIQLSINLAYGDPADLDKLKLETNENNIRGLTGFCVLSRASLENATVDVVDPAFACDHTLREYLDDQAVFRWTEEEKRRQAAKIKEELLKPGTHWEGVVPASLSTTTTNNPF